MGFWGVLLELARAVVPHAAPHVARAVVDRAKERRAAESSRSTETPQPSNESLAHAISYLEHRLAVTEEKASAAEELRIASEARAAERWTRTKKVLTALIAWNAIVTAGLAALLIYILVHR